LAARAFGGLFGLVPSICAGSGSRDAVDDNSLTMQHTFNQGGTAFDERGPVDFVDFDYDAIDGERDEDPEISGVELVSALCEWVVQTVPRNRDGIELRAVIAAWTFCSHLRGYNLTEISAMVGRDKQSLGRWVEDFKKTFPGVMRPGRTRKHGNHKATATRAHEARG